MSILSNLRLRQNFLRRMCFFMGQLYCIYSAHFSSYASISYWVKFILKSLITVLRRLWIQSKNMLTERGRMSIVGVGAPFSLDFTIFAFGFSGPNSSVSYLTFFLRKLFYRRSCLIQSRRNSQLLAELRESSLSACDFIGVGFVFLDYEGWQFVFGHLT